MTPDFRITVCLNVGSRFSNPVVNLALVWVGFYCHCHPGILGLLVYLSVEARMIIALVFVGIGVWRIKGKKS